MPHPDNPKAGLTGFGDYINKVLGIDSCQCPICQLEPVNILHPAVQCTAIQYEYIAYGNAKSEDIIMIDLGKPSF